MNPWPIVLATFKAHPSRIAIFVLLIAVAAGLGMAMTMQERALRKGSARAADKFDIIVTAPGSHTEALLQSVFLRPGAPELIAPDETLRILAEPKAALAAPLGFGDSHDGNPVVGTTAGLVNHLSSGELGEGRMFAAHEEAVIGAASPLRIGDKIHAAHGHDAHQGEHGAEITIVGRMKPTGSPWDRAVIVPIEFTWEVHGLPNGHAPEHAERVGPPFDPDFTPGVPAIVIKPESLIAAYGLRSKYRSERTTAFFPAETLVSLYELLGDMRVMMSALAIGTQVLVIAAVLAALAVLLETNRRQYAILRALGASRRYIFAAVWLYVTLVMAAGAVLGLAVGLGFAHAVSAILARQTGITLQPLPGLPELQLAGVLVLAGALFATIPAIMLYRQPAVAALRQG
ncbi:MAG: ABC transporter permease [Rhizobiales bacterium]|nr:ABC transporter permease [Hyphomicrobiales bacterium]